MNIGPLYKVKKLFWLLFPSKSVVLANAFAITATETSREAAHHSNSLNCFITYLSPNDLIVLIEEDDKRYKKVLTTDGRIGWIVFAENIYSDCFEEVKST